MKIFAVYGMKNMETILMFLMSVTSAMEYHLSIKR